MTKIDIYKVKIKGKIEYKSLREFVNQKYRLRLYDCTLCRDEYFKNLKDAASFIKHKLSWHYAGFESSVNIFYKRHYDIDVVKGYIIKTKNLNFLEKLIFEHHLKNFNETDSE